MSDIEKPVEEGPAATGAGVANGTAAAQTTKSPTFLDKLSLFTIGKNRGQLPPAKGMWLQFLSGCGCLSVSARKVDGFQLDAGIPPEAERREELKNQSSWLTEK
jgi:hypothetical protein